jgi:CBS domain-containing protein
MRARDVMVSPVVTTTPSSSVADVAALLLERRISAVPVVDEAGKLIGIISEGDLIRRPEADTERRRSWWLKMFTSSETLAREYIRTHATKVADLMTRDVITASPDTPLHEVATRLERNGIKRVPILEDGRLVGIVSRANLVQALAARRSQAPPVSLDDQAIRDRILALLGEQPWARNALVSITVTDGVVDLWGFTNSTIEQKALHVAAEQVPGVRGINDHLVRRATGE